MKKIAIPHFAEKSELFAFLKKNLWGLKAEKLTSFKAADDCSFVCPIWDAKSNSFKAEDISVEDIMSKGVLKAKLAINTTNILDSHGDVHMPGLWKKNLKESAKKLMLLKQHSRAFEDVIAEGLDGEVKGYTEEMTWKELGFPQYKGSTEVLVFEVEIKKENHEQMFKYYVRGRVKNHSVGMQYVKIEMCINSEEKYYIDEKENWDKYYPEVVNQEAADERGYFWAVTEAKVVEGSAVTRGSNGATPVLEVKSRETTLGKQSEPAKTTPLDGSYLINAFK